MPANPPTDITFRTEQPGEEASVRAVVADAFGGPEHTHDGEVVAELVDRLRASPDWIDGLSFVAHATDGDIRGHILFTRSLLDARPRLIDVLVLSPVSVATQWQGQGIGSALLRHGLDVIGRRSEPLAFLEGDPGLYARFGFEAAGPLGFRRPSLRIPEPAFQVLKLPGYESWMTGTLVYSRVFWDMDCVGLRDPRLASVEARIQSS